MMMMALSQVGVYSSKAFLQIKVNTKIQYVVLLTVEWAAAVRMKQ